MEVGLVLIVILLIITGLIIGIAKLFGKELSIFRVFGVVDVIAGIVVLIVAIIEMVTPGGDMNGLFGQVILLFFEPTVIICLIIDILLYKKIGKKITWEE